MQEVSSIDVRTGTLTSVGLNADKGTSYADGTGFLTKGEVWLSTKGGVIILSQKDLSVIGSQPLDIACGELAVGQKYLLSTSENTTAVYRNATP